MKAYLTVVEFAAAGITKQAVYKRIKQDLAPLAGARKKVIHSKLHLRHLSDGIG